MINYDLEENPLLIKLDPTFFTSPKRLSLALFTDTLGHITTIHLRFEELVTVEVVNCVPKQVLAQEISGKEQIWRITKDQTSVGIFCDHEEQIRLLIEDGVRCGEKLSLDVGNVIFISGSQGVYWKPASQG